jgi:hypothetical protein
MLFGPFETFLGPFDTSILFDLVLYIIHNSLYSYHLCRCITRNIGLLYERFLVHCHCIYFINLLRGLALLPASLASRSHLFLLDLQISCLVNSASHQLMLHPSHTRHISSFFMGLLVFQKLSQVFLTNFNELILFLHHHHHFRSVDKLYLTSNMH